MSLNLHCYIVVGNYDLKIDLYQTSTEDSEYILYDKKRRKLPWKTVCKRYLGWIKRYFPYDDDIYDKEVSKIKTVSKIAEAAKGKLVFEVW